MGVRRLTKGLANVTFFSVVIFCLRWRLCCLSKCARSWSTALRSNLTQQNKPSLTIPTQSIPTHPSDLGQSC